MLFITQNATLDANDEFLEISVEYSLFVLAPVILCGTLKVANKVSRVRQWLLRFNISLKHGELETEDQSKFWCKGVGETSIKFEKIPLNVLGLRTLLCNVCKKNKNQTKTRQFG